MEELIDTLSREDSEYKTLLELSDKKTPVIVDGNVNELQKITDEEQFIVDRIANLERKREQVMKDIADVINKDVTTLKLSELIEMLKGQPKEQQELAVLHDSLKQRLNSLLRINEHNGILLKQSLDMVEFDLHLIHAARRAPETANYTRGATNVGSSIADMVGGFDAKQ